MKKLFMIFLLLVFVSPVFAATWEQIGEKTWVDIDSIKVDPYIKTIKYAWFKDLNPGNWDTENNKKVWYRLNLIDFKCNEGLLNLHSYASYDLKGNLIDTETWSGYKWNSVIPESIGETKFHTVCEAY